MTTRLAKVNGVRLAYRMQGEGPHLVLTIWGIGSTRTPPRGGAGISYIGERRQG
jgi:hypothetical protein